MAASDIIFANRVNALEMCSLSSSLIKDITSLLFESYNNSLNRSYLINKQQQTEL